MKNIFLPVILLALCFHTSGQNGLDQSFGTNGYTRTFFPVTGIISYNDVKQVLADPDGSFYLILHASQQTVISRRLPDGSLDQAYGENGYSIPVEVGWGHAVLLPDKKIVLGGIFYYANYIQDFGMARLTAGGKLDSSFSGDGIQTTDFSSPYDFISGIALQNDGKIVAVGTFDNHQGFALARYNPDGSPDNSFSGDGKQVTQFENSFTARPTAVAVDANGRIIVAGVTGAGFTVAAYLPDGTPDNQFSSDGKEFYTASPLYGAPNALVIQNDGKIVVAGNTYGSEDFNFNLLRLNFDGTYDNSFSDDGKVLLNLPPDNATGLAIDNSGSIWVSGSAYIDGHEQVLLAKFTSSGIPDNSFSEDGFASARISDFYISPGGLAIQSNGKILVVGNHTILEAGNKFFVVRFNSNGTLDNSMDGDGILSDFKQYGYTSYNASAVQTDGKIITAGVARIATFINDFAVARYNTDGSLDKSFSQDGMLTIPFNLPGGAFQTGVANAIAIQADGKIIVVGSCSNSQEEDFAIVRLNPDGSLDNTFSGDGKVTADFTGPGEIYVPDQAYAVSIQADGKIVVAGTRGWDFALARYNADGTPDNSFSLDGKLVTQSLGQALDIVILPDGKIVAAGGGRRGGDEDFAIVRYLTNGELDQSFGLNGIATIDFGGYYEFASAMSLLQDGRIIIAGTTGGQSGTRMAVAKINPNGSPDLSFSLDGKVVLQLGSTTEYCTSLVLLPDGRILLGGHGAGDLALVRLNPDGTLDNNFIFPGSYFLNLHSNVDRIESLSIHNNRIYAAGNTVYGGPAGLLAALSIECSMTATIPNAMALSNGVEPNTVYIGYAPASSLRLSAVANTGTPPYTYLWSTGQTTQSIVVSPNAATDYWVTVSDGAGCSKTVTTSVKVVDVRCGNKLGNVLICQVTPGNSGKTKSACINANAVASLLSNGSYLGNCRDDLRTITSSEIIQEKDDFSIHVSPNPSKDVFLLSISSSSKSKAELIVRDISGRTMGRRVIDGNSQITIGAGYAPGYYFVELISGEEKRVVRIVKLSK
jgi:uncharacterized delta-60 repeat protein